MENLRNFHPTHPVWDENIDENVDKNVGETLTIQVND